MERKNNKNWPWIGLTVVSAIAILWMLWPKHHPEENFNNNQVIQEETQAPSPATPVETEPVTVEPQQEPQQATQQEEPEKKVDITYKNSSITFVIEDVKFVMKKVEGGTFSMGATAEQESEADSNEKPVHTVTVSSFYMGETEVTQALWKAVMDKNPSHHRGNNYPVESVSWYDCQKFIGKLNELTGKKFRLPTEAEWEYAARGGKYSHGYKYAGSNDLDSVAWSYNADEFKTHAVKQKKPNELGLYDMSGNVLEWCFDYYGDYSGEAQNNPTGPDLEYYDDDWDEDGRVLRGGTCLLSKKDICRVSYRHTMTPTFHYDDFGLRLVLEE